MKAGTVRLIGWCVVREVLDGCVVIAACTSEAAAQAAYRLLSS